MNLRRLLPRVLCCALGALSFAVARADNFSFSGNFSADNSVYQLQIVNPTSQTFTFNTSSFAMGGFEPVLTLFNASGTPVDNFGSGVGDASLTDTLAMGTYQLFLTEFPNVAIGNQADGFLFAASPTATGDICGVSGGMFLDTGTSSCTQLGSNFALNVSSTGSSSVTPVAATPEPSSLLLMLAPAAGLVWTGRRRLLA